MGAASPALLVLIGMMGSGKTTAGRAAAARLGWRFVDTDEEVERLCGSSVAEIFATAGEGTFRAKESDVVKDVLGHSGAPIEATVLAVAGGAILDPATRARLKEEGGRVVWLRATPATLAARVGDAADRPLVAHDPAGELSRLEAARSPLYAGLADHVVDVDGMPPEAVVDAVLAYWHASEAGGDGTSHLVERQR